MNEFLIAAFTAFLGMITYVIGQIVVKLFDPAYDLRAHFGAIARDLYLYANRHPKIATDEERLKIFRKLASTTLFSVILSLPPRGCRESGNFTRRSLERSISYCRAVTKEAAGIHVPLTSSLFACDILCRLLPRVSEAKPTSVLVRL
jgi:hypothetical protein